jgi:phage tail-like protein
MTKFTVNPTRRDPYKTFRFRLKFEGRDVAGVEMVVALKDHVDPAKHDARVAPRTGSKSTDAWKYEPITLERGVTHDPDFWKWATSTHASSGSGPKASTGASHKDLVLEQYDEAGKLVAAYAMKHAWISGAEGGTDHDTAGEVSIKSLKIRCDSWEPIKL